MGALIILFFSALGAGCGGGSGGGGGREGDSASATAPPRQTAPTVAVAQTRPGGKYTAMIEVAETGDTIVATVFEPALLVAGGAYPLVLHSHGYGGSRSTSPTDFQQRLIDAGYYVVSFDQRGFGDSTGTVRIQSPDFEGYDLIALLDWAENLPGLARRDNGKMLVGSYGGSYGGMYQLLLAAIDPLQRLRVIAPDITPYDLVYSLYQNEVLKSGWALALVAGGELPLFGLVTAADPASVVGDVLERLQHLNPPLNQDLAVFEIVLRAFLNNRAPEAGVNFLAYHSFRHFCDTQNAGSQEGLISGQPDPIETSPFNPGEFPPAIDALITQGMRDTLFNFNNALANYRCLEAAGGDVRLLTHQGGHILPASLETFGLEEALDPLYAAINVPEFQGPSGPVKCGPIDIQDATFAWFQAKLKGKEAALDAALPFGQEICLSLSAGDAVTVDQVTTGGRAFPLEMDSLGFNGVLGIVGSLLGTVPSRVLLADQRVFTSPAGGGVVLAGIPTLEIEISPLAGPALECALPVLPLACDPIFFIGLGHRSPGQMRWQLIDDQLTPLRDFGNHSVKMVGVAERLYAGDEVAVLVFGFHPQYPVTFSRDLLVPAVHITGQVALPLLEATQIERDI